MGKAIIGIICLVIGVIVGAVGGLSLGGGALAGAGVGIGLSSGICTTVDAAQDLGLLSSEQVDEVLARAAEKLTGEASIAKDTEIVSGAAECSKVMENLRAAQR